MAVSVRPGLTGWLYHRTHNPVVPFTSLREWPQDVAKAERRANEPTVLPVHIAPPLHADVPQPVTNEPVTLFLPGGVRMCCQPSQLTDVFRALKYAQS
ncbi:IS66 family insertion sequence element accessory protein TnpA [Escherichia coli]|uniref:IS66 family insertion sequence element accessory protein TnpA n=1 Tax=Escherichia coli TaxID=562 RepID=UPI003D803172